jgi:hypothetical protein
MARNKLTKLELFVLWLLTGYFLFVATNVNQFLGTVFALFTVGSIIFIQADLKRQIPLRKESGSFLGSLVMGALGYAALLITSFLVAPTIAKIQNLLANTTPALADSIFFNNLSFGVGIPFAETMFFFIVGFDVLLTVFGVSFNKSQLGKLPIWLIMFSLSFAFMFFHLTAKGIANVEILTIVFFMAIISMFLVVWQGDGEAAIYFHMIANLIAIL